MRGYSVINTETGETVEVLGPTAALAVYERMWNELVAACNGLGVPATEPQIYRDHRPESGPGGGIPVSHHEVEVDAGLWHD